MQFTIKDLEIIFESHTKAEDEQETDKMRFLFSNLMVGFIWKVRAVVGQEIVIWWKLVSNWYVRKIHRIIFVSKATGNPLMKKAGEKKERVKYRAVSNLGIESLS